MFRIKDPARTIPFYTDMFGFRLVDKYQFDSFSLYFLETPRPDDTTPKPEPGAPTRRGRGPGPRPVPASSISPR